MRYTILFLFSILGLSKGQAQQGCTDPQAINFSMAATENDGSCQYAPTSYTPELVHELSDTLSEISGLAYFQGALWAHNDSGDEPVIYRIDSVSGTVVQRISIRNAQHVDWEDMATDDRYLYIGDFGNNSGSRRDLRCYRIEGMHLHPDSNTVQADIIDFVFSDQTDFDVNANQHNFDCEAFFVQNGNLHLFSKNWLDNRTRHYILPTSPGSHTAQLVDAFEAEGLITAADVASDGTVVLLGYAGLEVFMWLLFDHPQGAFFQGNKRRIELGSIGANSQAEAIVYTGLGHGFIGSERFQIIGPGIPARLMAFESNQWTDRLTSTREASFDSKGIKVFPSPTTDELHLQWDKSSSQFLALKVALYDEMGRLVKQLEWRPSQADLTIDMGDLPMGSYYLHLRSDAFSISKQVQKR